MATSTGALISQGSTGTHSITRLLKDKLYRPANWNHHERDPYHKQFNKELNIAYLFCNPLDYVLALFRIQKRTPSWIVDHTKNTGGDWKYFQTPRRLDEFLEDDYDPFKYWEHFEGYRDSGRRILFVRYEQLKRGIDALCEYWNVKTPAGWKYRKRVSDWTTSRHKAGLLRKYGRLMERYNDLPLIFEHAQTS